MCVHSVIRIVHLPASWNTATDIDHAVARAGELLATGVTSVEFHLPEGCKLWLDGVLRLLSLCNQLAAVDKPTTLRFRGERNQAMGYIDRMGFFDYLARSVETEPPRPLLSGAELFRGGNNGLVEIAPVNRHRRDESLPDRLTEVLRGACAARSDADNLAEAVWTVFSELIGNIHDHSDTDGYVALQAYRGGQKAKVVVCDNGAGLMDTLRPALDERNDAYRNLTDVELLVEMFRDGLSRHPEAKRGQGLKSCAAKAIRFRGILDVRLKRQHARLVPSRGEYQPSMAYCSDGLPPLRGTHIAFTFGLAT